MQILRVERRSQLPVMFKSCEDAKDIYINDDNIENRVEHIKHFLETMLNPELTLFFCVQ